MAAGKAGIKLRNFAAYIVCKAEPGSEPCEMANWVNGKRVKQID